MQNNVTRHSARAALDLRPSGVLVVKLCGLLTHEALRAVKASIVADYSRAYVAAFVADYAGAIVAMDGDGLDRVLEGESYGSVPSLPAAMIVRPEMLELFSGHSLRMAGRGVVRQAFTDAVCALSWATRHALRTRT